MRIHWGSASPNPVVDSRCALYFLSCSRGGEVSDTLRLRVHSFLREWTGVKYDRKI